MVSKVSISVRYFDALNTLVSKIDTVPSIDTNSKYRYLAQPYSKSAVATTIGRVLTLGEGQFQGDKHDAYVRITLHQHYRVVKEKRTNIARPSRDGGVTFAEGFNFKMAPSQVDVSSLAFHVFQATSGYGRDKLIGKIVLGSYMFARGRALDQWNAAIANPMEQNQCWHTLSE